MSQYYTHYGQFPNLHLLSLYKVQRTKYMRLKKLFERYSVLRRPILRVVNPRVGTVMIPLDYGDGQIFFQYLTNKIHSLQFKGSEYQLCRLIDKMQEEKGFTIHKMKTSLGRGRNKLFLLHLKFSDDQEIRRIIKLI